MKKDSNECIDQKDILHHLLEEQIAYICVKEEEEQLREERIGNHSQADREGY
ncbi:hypothetical protein [Bacillus tuaregi]|uniref:hypothetical protein n=1 Tax=Bacillus tuaregi TaxID=1816695 RepID=UPI00164D0371|nr:hypothetical protein [Bacillus tuaregi]